MKTITLTLREHGWGSVDASRLRLDRIGSDESTQQSGELISHWMLASTAGDVELGEIFEVDLRSNDDDQPTLVMRGDCRRLNSLGHQHRFGRILVEGDIGDHCGSCMSGGSIRVTGNAGHHLGGASGTRGVGMNGGLLTVGGNAGDFAGHRMRRGEIRVAGNVGDALASWQVAGTIGVGGTVGRNVAYGMRRGTLVLATPVQLPVIRFTKPVALETPFQALLMNRTGVRKDLSMSESVNEDGVWNISRGDRSIGGIGEVWCRVDVRQ